MGGWRFADRGWFVNDGLNLRSEANRSLVANELVFPNVAFGVHRWFAGGSSLNQIAITHLDLRDPAWPWQQALAEHSVDGGEVWLFDAELLWRDHDRRIHGAEPPETWTANHGICLVDGYVPDEHGRVVCGGPD